jgi:hypothetical protein
MAEAQRVLIEEAGARLDPRAVSALFSALHRELARWVPSVRTALAS